MQRPTELGDRAGDCRFAFCASTGRTATMFVARTLDTLPGISATHEGHVIGDERKPLLPLINFQNRKAWSDRDYAAKTASDLRSAEVLRHAAGGASVLVDIAFNNAPFLDALSARHPKAKFLAIFRRCEGFVRSATIVSGEDTQPAGWPDRAKPLTDREKFIELGRLKPAKGTEYDAIWNQWSAIERNIWLWSTVNAHLWRFTGEDTSRGRLLFEDLAEAPVLFWEKLLRTIGQDTPANRARCVELSSRKTNQRSSYQVGPLAEWSRDAQALYERLARPLEEKIYGG